MTDNQTIKEIEKAIRKYWGPFEMGYPSLPKTEYNIRGSSAGQVRYTREGVERLRFNLTLAKQNLNEFLTRTVPHELGHILAFYRHGPKAGHGQGWKQACKDLGMKEITRCHNYKVPRSARKPHDVQCVTCKEVFFVTKKVYKRILENQRYSHNPCKSKLIAI